MRRPTERSAIEDPYRLKQSVAIKKASVERRDHRLFFGHKLAVEENDHLADPTPIPDGSLSASINPLPFASVSSYSISGIESATIPAPT